MSIDELKTQVSEYIDEDTNDWVLTAKNETKRVLEKSQLKEAFTRECMNCRHEGVQRLTQYFTELIRLNELESYRRLAFAVHISPDHETFQFLVKEVVGLGGSFEQAFIEWADWEKLSEEFGDNDDLEKFFIGNKPSFYFITESEQDVIDSEIFSRTLYVEFKKRLELKSS